jgi:hypothetical protein
MAMAPTTKAPFMINTKTREPLNYEPEGINE